MRLDRGFETAEGKRFLVEEGMVDHAQNKAVQLQSTTVETITQSDTWENSLHQALDWLDHQERMIKDSSLRSHHRLLQDLNSYSLELEEYAAVNFKRQIENHVQFNAEDYFGLYDKLVLLRSRIGELRERVTRMNEQELVMVRDQFRNQEISSTAFSLLLKEFCDLRRYGNKAFGNYDDADAFFDQLVGIDRDRAPYEKGYQRDMVFYQPTPVHLVLEMVDALKPTHHDVIYDLGAGYGRVCLLISLLTQVQTRGVEYFESYITYTRQRAAVVGREAQALFIEGDVRDVDLSDGTIFYLFNHFGGETLRAVMDRLKQIATTRTITVCSLGMCSGVIAKEPWLIQREDSGDSTMYHLQFFTSQLVADQVQEPTMSTGA